MAAIRLGLMLFIGGVLYSLYLLYSFLDEPEAPALPLEVQYVEHYPDRDKPCTIYQLWLEKEQRFTYVKECSQQ